MRHWFALVLLGLFLVPVAGLASSGPADAKGEEPAAPAALVLPTQGRLAALTAGRDGLDPPPAVRALPDRDHRRTILSSLHAVTGVVQTYDGMLTMRVLRAGGVEVNPLMKPATGNEGVLLGVKIAAAVATVIGTETLWRDNHRVAALVTSIVANSAMAMIARHNAQVLARLESR